MISRPLLILVCGCTLAGPAAAGSLDAPAAPTTPGGGAMYTLNDLYNRLNAGTAGTPRSGVFVEPAVGPGSTMRTLTEIMNKMPAVDANGATTADVLNGKTFWGLTSGGAWGLQTGNMAPQTVNTTTTSQNAGYYNAFNLATEDADLAAPNIKSGISIFGVAGTYAGSGGTISAPFPVAKTGAGAIAGYTLNPNEDGTLQRGATWPSPRFTDNGNGTITDNLTGLVWLKDANCANTSMNWFDALIWVATLKGDNTMCAHTLLNDGSVAGQWRLPNIKEFSSLVSAEASFALPAGHPFMDVQYNKYWSSTTFAFDTGKAWQVDFHDGYVSWMTKNDTITPIPLYVWPVRGGQ